MAGADRSKPVTVRADGRATHQSVVTAMDVLGKLGFVRINIATVEDSQAAEMNRVTAMNAAAGANRDAATGLSPAARRTRGRTAACS